MHCIYIYFKEQREIKKMLELLMDVNSPPGLDKTLFLFTPAA
jgi:hypothetical protein